VKKIMLRLIEESEDSENISKEEAKKHFLKYVSFKGSFFRELDLINNPQSAPVG
jgi:hypothetical protein